MLLEQNMTKEKENCKILECTGVAARTYAAIFTYENQEGDRLSNLRKLYSYQVNCEPDVPNSEENAMLPSLYFKESYYLIASQYIRSSSAYIVMLKKGSQKMS